VLLCSVALHVFKLCIQILPSHTVLSTFQEKKIIMLSGSTGPSK
jgi:hypothetical protein